MDVSSVKGRMRCSTIPNSTTHQSWAISPWMESPEWFSARWPRDNINPNHPCSRSLLHYNIGMSLAVIAESDVWCWHETWQDRRTWFIRSNSVGKICDPWRHVCYSTTVVSRILLPSVVWMDRSCSTTVNYHWKNEAVSEAELWEPWFPAKYMPHNGGKQCTVAASVLCSFGYSPSPSFIIFNHNPPQPSWHKNTDDGQIIRIKIMISTKRSVMPTCQEYTHNTPRPWTLWTPWSLR